MKIRLQYVQAFSDRHGKPRYYFRRPGYKRIPLPGSPGSAEFMTAYHAALGGHEVERAPIGAGRSAAGTLSSAIAAYYCHPSFTTLATGTQKMRRAILESFRADHGERRLALLEQKHIATLLGAKKAFAARNWLKTLRGLMQFAVVAQLRRDDPTDGLKPMKAKAGTIATWTEAEIARYRERHPVGSTARLAMELLLGTAQRRGDVVRMGPQHVRDGLMTIRQEKTGNELVIPLHPELAAVLTASTIGHLSFLTTGAGKPFTAAGFGNLFRDWCNEAGLPAHCSSHGLRKAACRRLAEAGCSEHQIAAISGHESLSEVRRYTRAANRAGMARDAMATVTAAFPQARTGTASVKPSRPV